MKSVQIENFTQNLEDIKVVDAPIPEPGPGQVRVKMLCSSVNPSDFNFIRGDYETALKRVIWNFNQDSICFDPQRLHEYPALPYALGGEGVGIVDACGQGLLAKRLKGKRVAIPAGPPNGAWQEYTLAEAKKAIVMPDNLSNEQAAMFVINPMSAYIMIKEVLKVTPNSWLLQSAGGSALAKNVIRLSKELGFKTINIVRNKAHTKALKELGADVVIETDSQDIISEVARVTHGQGAEFAMDCIGGETAEQMIRCLTLNGHMVAYGTLSDTPVNLPYRDMMMPTTRLTGFYAYSWFAQQSLFKLISVLRSVSKLSKKGIFNTPVEKVYDIDDVQAALAASIETGRSGKILLKISE